MNYEKGTDVATKRPDLQEFIDGLRQQNDYFGKQAEELFFFANQFKDCRQPTPENGAKSKEPQGIIEMLNVELNRMRTYNDTLRQTVEGLQSVIGR